MRFWDLPAEFQIFCAVTAAVLGAVFGSFLNCAAYRVARKESFVSGRSHCPSCGHELGAADLVPVVSWLALRGRCRYCKEKISPRYVIAELLFAAITVGCVLRFGLTVTALRNWLFLCCLFLLSLVDLEIREIPDGCLLAAVLIWLLAEPFLWKGWPDALGHVLAAAVYGGALLLISLGMARVRKKERMGGGDVKLLAVIGLYLGLLPTLFCVILSCVLGLLQSKLFARGRAIPFGPALAASAAVMLAAGEELAGWYLSLF